jgi:hypothetical protein
MRPVFLSRSFEVASTINFALRRHCAIVLDLIGSGDPALVFFEQHSLAWLDQFRLPLAAWRMSGG